MLKIAEWFGERRSRWSGGSMKKLILLFIFSSLWASAQYGPFTLADISGDGAAHPIASTGAARLIIISALPTNSTTNCGTASVSGCPRVGDSNISTSRGQFLVPGSSMTFPAMPPGAGDQTYLLSNVYYLVQSGDKISITYVQ